MVGVWYTLLRPSGFSLSKFLLEKVIVLGLGAFISYKLIYFTSLASFRQRWYELFLVLHVVLQILALIFLWFHHSGSRVYAAIALVIFLVDRLIYRCGFKSISVRANIVVMEDGETVKLSTHVLKRPQPNISKVIGRPIKDGWEATDHVFVLIPSLSRTNFVQAHPFTIASAAPPHGIDETRLDLLIRAQDGFSRDLLKKARHLEHCSHGAQHPIDVRLDGPYGSDHARHVLEYSDLALVVAGGSGIAVAWPLIHVLEISRSTDTEIAPTKELRRQKIALIWVVHQKSHIEWIGRKALAEVENMGVEIIIPQPTEETGRPDLAVLIQGMVENFSDKKMGVVTSGPGSMGRLVKNTCASLVRDGYDINVTVEKF